MKSRKSNELRREKTGLPQEMTAHIILCFPP